MKKSEKNKKNELITTEKNIDTVAINDITTPSDLLLIPLEEYANEICVPYEDTSFLNLKSYKVPNNVNLKGYHSRLMQIKDYIARVDIDTKEKTFTVSPKIAGVVKEIYTINQNFNNRKGLASTIYHEVKIKESLTGREFLLPIDYEALANDKSFKAKIQTLSSLKNDECTEFVATFVSKKNPIEIEEYINTGRLDFSTNDWLWWNGAYYKGKMIMEDSSGNIPIAENKYIRCFKNSRYKPKYVTNEKPIKQVLEELFKNIYDSWDGALEPFLAICFMALSAFCFEFWKKEGFGSIAFVGDTEAGKSEIITLGLGIYGLDKFFMGTTRNTLVGVEQKMNTVNGIPVIIDDISKFRLTGDSFIDELKRLSHGFIRDKGKNGQESGALPPCCPFGFNANHIPVEKPEILNRILYLNTDNVRFYPQKFKYFDKGIEELSCILPHILSIGFDRVNQFHNNRKQWLLKNYNGISDRMASQIAIALAGWDVLNEIAQTELKIPLEKFTEYVCSSMQRFETAKTPMDRLLEAFPIMIWNDNIRENEQYKIDTSKGYIELKFHKKAVCLAFNKYVAMDISERIDSRSLNNKSTEYYRILKFDKPQKYGKVNHSSIVLDISNHPSVTVILEKHREIQDYKAKTVTNFGIRYC